MRETAKVVGLYLEKLLACPRLAMSFRFGAGRAGHLPVGWSNRSDFRQGCLCDSDGEPS